MGTPTTVRAVHFVAPGRFEVVDKPVPPADEHSALVAPAFVGLCGTDLDLLRGTMPYFALGYTWHPMQPGHEWSGVVLGSGDSRFGAGQRVIFEPIVGCGRCERCAMGRQTHCSNRREIGVRGGLDGALATAIAVPASHLVPIPEGVRLRDAVLVEPMVTVLNGIERARPQPGDEALVVGAGTLALLAAMLLVARGLRTHVLVRNPLRVATVEEAGGIPWRPGEKAAAADFDVVIEAAGTAEGAVAAFAHTSLGARVSLLGVPDKPVPMDIATLVTRDVTAFGVLNGPGQFQAGLEAIAGGIVRPEVLVDRVYPFEEVAAAFARSQERDRARPKVLVQVDPDATDA